MPACLDISDNVIEYANKVNAMQSLTWVQKFDLIQQFMYKSDGKINISWSVDPDANACKKMSEAEAVEAVAHECCLLLAGQDRLEDVTDEVMNSGIY